MECGGAGFVLVLAAALISPVRYWPGGLGDVAEETEEESYDLEEGFGDRGNCWLCEEVAIVSDMYGFPRCPGSN